MKNKKRTSAQLSANDENRMDWEIVTGYNALRAYLSHKGSKIRRKIQRLDKHGHAPAGLKAKADLLSAVYDELGRNCRDKFRKLRRRGYFKKHPITSEELTKAANGVFTRSSFLHNTTVKQPEVA